MTQLIVYIYLQKQKSLYTMMKYKSWLLFLFNGIRMLFQVFSFDGEGKRLFLTEKRFVHTTRIIYSPLKNS